MTLHTLHSSRQYSQCHPGQVTKLRLVSSAPALTCASSTSNTVPEKYQDICFQKTIHEIVNSLLDNRMVCLVHHNVSTRGQRSSSSRHSARSCILASGLAKSPGSFGPVVWQCWPCTFRLAAPLLPVRCLYAPIRKIYFRASAIKM